MKLTKWLNKHHFIKYNLPVYSLMSLIFLLSIIPGYFISSGIAQTKFINFNFLHLIAYCVLGFYMNIALTHSKKQKLNQHPYYFTILICFIFGTLNESIQYFVPERFFGLIDICYNLIGSLISQIILYILKKK